MHRYMRVAFSVVFAAVTLLLVAMWLRSYSFWDFVSGGITTKESFLLSSQSGAALLTYDNFEGMPVTSKKWHVLSIPPLVLDVTFEGLDESRSGFHLHFTGWRSTFFLSTPYWFLVLLSIATAVLTWVRWRFSLRTLLIVTTLVATALGIIVVFKLRGALAEREVGDVTAAGEAFTVSVC